MASVASPRDATAFGARVRHARLSANLSQAELARALAAITKANTTKGLVSQWEAGRVANPRNETILALTAVTGFAQRWLITGLGPKLATLPKLKVASRDTETRALLRRAILLAIVVHKEPAAIADAAIEVFETLQDEPNAPEGSLKRIARLAAKS